MINEILFTKNAFEEYQYWQENDRKILKRINQLIKSISRDGEGEGIGKPERLKGSLSGYSSRRITQEHRIVYRVINNTVEIVQCRYHY